MCAIPLAPSAPRTQQYHYYNPKDLPANEGRDDTEFQVIKALAEAKFFRFAEPCILGERPASPASRAAAPHPPTQMSPALATCVARRTPLPTPLALLLRRSTNASPSLPAHPECHESAEVCQQCKATSGGWH